MHLVVEQPVGIFSHYRCVESSYLDVAREVNAASSKVLLCSHRDNAQVSLVIGFVDKVPLHVPLEDLKVL